MKTEKVNEEKKRKDSASAVTRFGDDSELTLWEQNPLHHPTKEICLWGQEPWVQIKFRILLVM